MGSGGSGAFGLHLRHSPDRRAVEELLSGSDPAGVVGRVTRSERGGAEVMTVDGTRRAVADVPVCTGDWVVLVDAERHGGDRSILAATPRRTAFVRQAADGVSSQVLAANADEVWVVVGLDQPLSLERLERTIVLAWESGADPVVVATKADLVTAAAVAAAASATAAIAPGAPLVVVSSTTGTGMGDLAGRLRAGRTVALLGASGAGKSTLLNVLTGRTVAQTGAVREVDGKGRHTTSWRHLEVLDGGGAIIDTPGLRGVGMWVDQGGIEAAFSDIAELTVSCRFRDCTHRSEPGCAVLAAVADGRLDRRRLDSWRRLSAEADAAGERVAARARAAQRGRPSGRSRPVRPRRG